MKNSKFWGSAGVILVIALSFITILLWTFTKYNIDSSGIKDGMEYGEYRYHFAMIVADKENPFWESVYHYANKFAKQNDAYLELLGANLSADYNEADYLNIAAAEKVDGILLAPDAQHMVTEEVNAALKAGIPVITMMEDIADTQRQCFVGVGNYSLGQEYGRQLIELMEAYPQEETQNILVLISASEDDAGRNLVFSSIKETVGEKNADIEAYTIKGESIFSTEEAIHNIIMNREKVPDILVCLNSVETECAYQAVVDYNKVGEIHIIGFYDSAAILGAIEKEIIYSTVAIDTQQMGKIGVQALLEYITMDRVSDFLSADVHIIDRSNVKQFLNQEEQAAYE